MTGRFCMLQIGKSMERPTEEAPAEEEAAMEEEA